MSIANAAPPRIAISQDGNRLLLATPANTNLNKVPLTVTPSFLRLIDLKSGSELWNVALPEGAQPIYCTFLENGAECSTAASNGVISWRKMSDGSMILALRLEPCAARRCPGAHSGWPERHHGA